MARTRGVHKAPANEVSKLQNLVDALIKENRQLKRRVEKAASSVSLDLRPVAGLVRKVERALADGRGAGRSAAKTPARKAPRKPASPETQEKRRQALARAREVRAAKLVNAQSKLIRLEETSTAPVEK